MSCTDIKHEMDELQPKVGWLDTENMNQTFEGPFAEAETRAFLYLNMLQLPLETSRSLVAEAVRRAGRDPESKKDPVTAVMTVLLETLVTRSERSQRMTPPTVPGAAAANLAPIFRGHMVPECGGSPASLLKRTLRGLSQTVAHQPHPAKPGFEGHPS
jgi:hypothetical protein